jgi:hypothetical protein
MEVRENVIGGHVQLTSRDLGGFNFVTSFSITTLTWLGKLLELTIVANFFQGNPCVKPKGYFPKFVDGIPSKIVSVD